MSIVPSRPSSRLSTSTNQTGNSDSIKSYASMIYRRLSFEDDLFTARVYKRNYRSPRLQHLRKHEPDPDDKDITPRKDRRHNMTVEDDLTAVPSPNLSTDIRTLSKGVNDNAQNVICDGIMVSTTISIQSEKINRSMENSGSYSTNDPYTKLTDACINGDSDRVELLLSMNPVIHSLLIGRKCDWQHRCPIHATVLEGHVDVMEKLLRHADATNDAWRVLENTMHCTIDHPWPPLHVATMNKNLPMVQLLLRMGAPVEVATGNGVRAIHLAARTDCPHVLAALIEAGADVNCADQDGRQPLHYISDAQDRPDIILYLAMRGATTTETHLSKRPTPLDLARNNNFAGNVDILSALTDEPSQALKTAIREGSDLAVRTLKTHGSDRKGCPVDWATFLRRFILGFHAHNRLVDEREVRILRRFVLGFHSPDPLVDTREVRIPSKFGPQVIGVISCSDTPNFVTVYTTGPRDILNN